MANNTNHGRSMDQTVQAGIDAANALDTDTRSEADKGYDEAVRTPWNGSEQAADTAGTRRGDAGNRQSARNEAGDDEEAQSLSGGGRPSDPTGVETAEGNQQSSS